MSTDLQRDLAEAIVENAKKPRYKRKNKKELLVSVGYDKTTAEKAQKRTIEQKGVQEELEDLGFNETNARKVVGEIMLDGSVDPNARLKATDQVFKVKGSYAPEKNVNLNMNVKAEAEQKANDVIRRFLIGKDGLK